MIKSIKNINLKLFFALLVMGLCPTVYITVRTFFLGQLPGEWAFSIAGQLSWVNLLYEIIIEAIILPLFFFVGKITNDKAEFTNRLKTGLLTTLCIYSVLSAVIIIFARPLLHLMAASSDILDASATYIRIESSAVQNEQAKKSKLSHSGKPMNFKLTDNWGVPIKAEQLYVPYFGERCQTCAMKPICNGCSRCRKCEKLKAFAYEFPTRIKC